MKTSDQIDLLSAAFVTAQGSLSNVSTDKENPFFKSKYATLANVRDKVVPVLSANGLAVIQGTIFEGGQFVFTCRMVHSSGQWIESTYPLASGKPQDMGSAITYARRYLLSSMCGISSEEDDDGNAAQNAKPKDTAPPIDNVAIVDDLIETILLCSSATELAALRETARFKGDLEILTDENEYKRLKAALTAKKEAIAIAEKMRKP